MNYKIIIKRFVLMVPMLIGITAISYSLMLLAPGDPTAMLADPKVNPLELARIKKNLGLDQPVFVQYWIWLKNILQGNFGYSFINGRPVLELILQRLPATLLLMGSSMIITLFLTIPLGILSAVNHRRHIDSVVTVFTFVGMSIPVFWLALVIIMFFSLHLQWLPSSGMLDPFLTDASFWERSLNILLHMVLPLVVMTIGSLAGLTKYMKTGMLSTLHQNYILAARAHGFSENRIVWKYAFKNALLPLITVIGLSIPNLVAGSFIIEYIFAWPGMGRLGVDSIFMRDFPVIMGIILMSSVLIIVGNLAADIAYALVDPRISYNGRRS